AGADDLQGAVEDHVELRPFRPLVEENLATAYPAACAVARDAVDLRRGQRREHLLVPLLVRVDDGHGYPQPFRSPTAIGTRTARTAGKMPPKKPMASA